MRGSIRGIEARRRRAMLLAGAAMCAALAQGGAALAAEAADADAPATTIEEITVFARKRAEAVQDVPVAISVLPKELVQSGNLDQVSKFVELVPNATFTQEGDTSAEISIRGSGRNLSDEDPSVGVYRDGIYIGGLLFSTATFYDTDHVEVLRGPQAGLYGRNAVGGALNVISTPPSFEFGGYVDLQLASKQRQELRAAVNLPVIDGVWAVRLSGLLINQDKGFDYIVNQDKYADATLVKSFRLRSLFQPNPDWRFLTTVEHITSDDGAPLVVESPDADVGYLDSSRTVQVPGTRPSDTTNQFRDTPESRRFEQTHVFQEINWETELGTATAVASYRSAKFRSMRDEDRTAFHLNEIAYDASQDSLFSELRFASETFGGVSFVAGLNYLDEDIALNFDNLIGGLFYGALGGANIAELYSGGVVTPAFAPILQLPVGTSIANAGLTPFARGWTGYLGDSFPTTYINEQTLKSTAVFIEANYAVNDKLEIWGNARYTHDEKTIHFSQGFTKDCQVACPEIFAMVFSGLDVQIQADTSAKFENLSGGAGVNYKLTPAFMAYAKVVTGFKGGGFNSIASKVSLLPFNEEKSVGYEAGVKTDWFDRRLRVNATVFLQDRKDALVSVADPFMPINSLGVNAGEIRNKGVELEIGAAPIEGLRLEIAAGYLDSKFRDFIVQGVDFSGNVVPRTFKYSLSAILTYDRPIADGIDAYGYLSYRNAWDGYTDNDNIEPLSNPETVDLRAGVKGEGWKVGVFVDNALDNRYTASEFRSLYDDGPHFGTFAPGRTWGVQAVREF